MKFIPLNNTSCNAATRIIFHKILHHVPEHHNLWTMVRYYLPRWSNVACFVTSRSALLMAETVPSIPRTAGMTVFSRYDLLSRPATASSLALLTTWLRLADRWNSSLWYSRYSLPSSLISSSRRLASVSEKLCYGIPYILTDRAVALWFLPDKLRLGFRKA